MAGDQALFAAAEALPPELFAVIDGGKFDDIARSLREAGLSGRPLYLEGGDPAARAAAGHLVPLHELRDLRAAIAIARAPGALVIWSWPKGEMALYRHLRTLNLVEIPNEAKADAEAGGEDASDMPAYETVLFRHWDPNVLGGLLPLLEGPQQARFLGAATALAFDATDLGRLMAVPRPAGLPAAAPGMLRFEDGQMEAVETGRRAASDARIGRYLRDVAPDHAAKLADDALLAFVQAERLSAVDAGLTTERAIGQWCFLTLTTEGRFFEQPGVAEYIRHPSSNPDQQIGLLLAALGPAARQLGRS